MRSLDPTPRGVTSPARSAPKGTRGGVRVVCVRRSCKKARLVPPASGACGAQLGATHWPGPNVRARSERWSSLRVSHHRAGQPRAPRGDSHCMHRVKSSTDSVAVEHQHWARWVHRSVPISPLHDWRERPSRNLGGAEGSGGKGAAASGARPCWNECSSRPEYVMAAFISYSAMAAYNSRARSSACGRVCEVES
jgi:hypothetical protein